MQTVSRELEAYESIIEHLQVLNDEAIETRPEEAEAIGDILNTLAGLHDCICDPDEYLVNISPCCTASVG